MYFYWLIYLRNYKNVFVILQHGLLPSTSEEEEVEHREQPPSILNSMLYLYIILFRFNCIYVEIF